MFKMINNKLREILYTVLVMYNSVTLVGYNALHASPYQIEEELIEYEFLIKNSLHSDKAFEKIIYTSGDFSFNYDTLANIGFTLDYQGESKGIIIAESMQTSQVLKGLSYDATSQEQLKWPERIHGHLAIEYSNGNPGNGSGILIGPNHVLTAAHNLYDRHGSGWVKQIRFAPGRHHDDYPRGDYKGCILLIPKKWGDRTFKEYEQYDYGIVILDSPIGVSLGWSGLLSLPGDLLQGTILSLTGYPGDKGTHDPHLPQMQKDYGTLKKVQGDQLLYDIKTYKGQSGGAIYVQQFPGYKGMYTIGVHTYGKEKEGEEYRGSYLTGEKLKLIVGCIKAYQLPNVGLFIPQLQKVNLPSTEPFITEEIRKTYESWARGAESGNKEDLYHIGMLYMKGKNEIQKDSDKAYAFFYQAAQDDGNKKGYAPALTALGAWFEQYGERHLLKAISLYQKAKSKNNAEAIRRLGLLYLEGKGLPKKIHTAESLLREAGEKGDGEADYHLARLYEEGIHVTQNTEYAAQLYEQAQKLGYKLPDQAQVLVKPLTDEEVRSKAFTQVFQSSLQQVKSLEALKQMAAQLSLFICYDKEDEAHTQNIEQFATDLVRAGIPEKNVYFDQWANRPGSNVTIYQHADRIFKADRILVMGSRGLKEKYERKEGGRGISSHQIENLLTRITKHGVEGIIPLWFADQQEESFPLTLRNIDQHFLGGDYFSAFFSFLEKVFELNLTENPLQSIKDGFEKKRLALTSDLLNKYKTKIEEETREQKEKDRKYLEDSLGISDLALEKEIISSSRGKNEENTQYLNVRADIDKAQFSCITMFHALIQKFANELKTDQPLVIALNELKSGFSNYLSQIEEKDPPTIPLENSSLISLVNKAYKALKTINNEDSNTIKWYLDKLVEAKDLLEKITDQRIAELTSLIIELDQAPQEKILQQLYNLPSTEKELDANFKCNNCGKGWLISPKVLGDHMLQCLLCGYETSKKPSFTSESAQDYNITYVKLEANSLEDSSENKISVAKVLTIENLPDALYQVIACHADMTSLANLSKVDQKRKKIFSQSRPWQSYLKGKFENNVMLYFGDNDFFPKVINKPLTWEEIARIDYFGHNHNQGRNDIKFNYENINSNVGAGFEVIYKLSGVGFIFKITPTTNQDIISVLQLLRAHPFRYNKVGLNFYPFIESLINNISLIGLKLKWQSMHDGLEEYMLEQNQVETKVRAIDILCSHIATNRMPQLESLDLTCNPIGNYGACSLAMALSSQNVLTSLHSLRLKEDRISDIGAFALGAMLRINRHISELDLNYNYLTEPAITYLRTIWQSTNRNPNLLRLDQQQEDEEINVHYNLGPDIGEII